MPGYTVVKSVKKKDAKDGAIVQLLTLKNAEGKEKEGVTLFVPAGQQPPSDGASLEGEVKWDANFNEWKFIRARTGAYNGRSGAGKGYQADPAKLEVERAKNRSIAAESAQKSAVEILRIAVECGAYKPPDANPISEMTTVVRSAAESLYQQIQQASEAAK